VNPVDWSGLTTTAVAERVNDRTVAVLPLGATEQHGGHLPLATDTWIARALVERAIHRLPAGMDVLRLPTLTLGQGLEHADWPGTLALSPATMEALLGDLGDSLARSGLRRLVLFTAHGGNGAAMEHAALRLRRRQGLLVVKSCYFDFPRPAGVFDDDEWDLGIHGGAVETAIMQALHPQWVGAIAPPDSASAGHPASATLGFENASGRVAWLAADIGPDGVAGDPSLATPQRGERLVAHYADELAAVLTRTGTWPLPTPR
jgi:creatinine amidohydrolase